MSEDEGTSAAELAAEGDVEADEDLDDRIEATLNDLDVSEAARAAGTDADDAEPSVPTTSGDTEDADEAADAGADTEDAAESTDEETVSVLEFVLGDERYCLDITFIEQIVERGTVTRIPNAPPFVEGVIDLRGDITTVIDPMETLAADDGGEGDLIVVFDSAQMDDEWSVGWAVDGVRRVSTVSLAKVKESPVDEPWINGVVKREDDGEFVIWTEPGELMRTDE
ncbi:chemotaxis protein CheW [Haloplanus litoreus]|uniref:Chemotaxis protein CheW n=1 Tax=Haloplanus litoreus TaxID=767515 RepID=A0ABD5ZZX6_9EURY